MEKDASQITQFSLACNSHILCDLCGKRMFPIYGCGFDYDRMLCMAKNCYAEIIYPTSTLPEKEVA